MTETTGAGESFADLFEKQTREMKEGEVVQGVVTHLDEDHVQVDVGFKSEGLIDAWEFMDDDARLLVNLGDRVDVLVEEIEDDSRPHRALQGEGRSAEDLGRHQQGLRGRRAGRGRDPLAREGRPGRRHRREGVPAGLAGGPAPRAQPRVGDRREARVQDHQVQQAARQHRAVAARAAREGAREAARDDARDPAGGSDRRRRDQEHHRLRRVHRPRRHRRPAPRHRHVVGPRQPPERAVPGRRRDQGEGAALRPGERARLARPEADPARSRGSTPRCATRSGARIQGKVVSLTDYGAFVELEPGIEGLVHVSEMSWTKRVKHPSKLVVGRRQRSRRSCSTSTSTTARSRSA